MKQQKFIFHSKTVITAFLSLLAVVIPNLIDAVHSDFDIVSTIQLIAIILTTAGNILSRYYAQGELYTPQGLMGRDYMPVRSED